MFILFFRSPGPHPFPLHKIHMERKIEGIKILKKLKERMECEYSERLGIEEVIGVVEWILFCSNFLRIFKFKRTRLESWRIWECEREEELEEMKKSIVLEEIGKGGRFCLEELLEIHFLFNFTLKKKKKINKCLEKLRERKEGYFLKKKHSLGGRNLRQPKRKKKEAETNSILSKLKKWKVNKQGGILLENRLEHSFLS